MRDYFSTTNLRIVNFGLVQAEFGYMVCVLVWGRCLVTLLNKVEVLEKAILKVMLCKPRTYAYALLFEEANVFDVTKLYIFQVLNYYKRFYKQSCIDYKYYTSEKTAMNVLTNKAKEISKQSLEYITPHFYNMLLLHIKTCKYVKYPRVVKPYIKNDISN